MGTALKYGDLVNYIPDNLLDLELEFNRPLDQTRNAITQIAFGRSFMSPNWKYDSAAASHNYVIPLYPVGERKGLFELPCAKTGVPVEQKLHRKLASAFLVIN